MGIRNGNEDEFQKLVLATANWEQLTNTLIQANLYQALKVPKAVFEKSAQVYLMEPAKFEAQKKMYEFVRSQRVAPQMINAVIKVEKLKADDHFFNETGIEEEDVEPSLKRLNLEEDEEFKAIVEEFKKKSDDFLASKKDETAAMMQKARIAQIQMEARRKAAMAAAAKKKAESAGAAANDDGDAAEDEDE